MTSLPFDPQQDDTQLEQPKLSNVLQNVIAEAGRQVRVCVPCSVVYIHGNQLVDLQPLLQVHYYANKDPTTLPVIPYCPVSMPMGADWSVKYPLALGDTGYAIFADRSLSSWLASKGGIVDPANPRTHDLSDAIFVPGLVPNSKQTKDTTQDLVMRNGTAQVRLEKNGTFRIANDGQELVDLVGQLTEALANLVTTLQQAQTITMLGPQPLWAKTQSDLVSSAVVIEQLAANLQTLKGV